MKIVGTEKEKPTPAVQQPFQDIQSDSWKAAGNNRLISLPHYKQILTAIQVFADSFTIVLSFLVGYSLWKLVGPWVAIDLYEPESLTRYYSFLGVTLITYLVGMEVHGLYQPQRSLMNVREFELVLKTWGKACLFTLGILFLAHQLYFSRGVFVLSWACMLIFMMVQRYAFFKFNNYLRRKGFVETTALIYGAGVVGRKLRLNDKVRTVIGVMPQRFMWRGADVYLPDVFHRGATLEGERQVHLLGRLGDGAEFDADRVADMGFNELLDRGLDGRGEEHGLALGRDDGHDALDGGQEAHVQHAVSFVEHKDFDIAELDQLAVQEIAEAAGGSDDNRRAIADLLELGAFVHAADRDCGVYAGAAGDLSDGLGDLQG